MTLALPESPTSRVEAYSMLAHHALSALWASSAEASSAEGDDIHGCCHVCCAPCAALLYLDRQGVLDAVLAEWPEGSRGSDMFPDGRLDRGWMYRQWSGSPVQGQCGHRFEPGTMTE